MMIRLALKMAAEGEETYDEHGGEGNNEGIVDEGGYRGISRS